MALFRKKTDPKADREPGPFPPPGPSPQRPTPPVDPTTAPTAARPIIAGLANATGGAARTRSAVSRLLEVSDTPTSAGGQLAAYQQDRNFMLRPWRWLSAAADRANEEGQHDVAAAACFFTLAWTRTAEPDMTGGDHLVSGFEKAPADAVDQITGAGAVAVLSLPDDFVVANTADGFTVTCAKLAELIAAGGSAAPSTVADELGKFASLRDRGVISEAEFQAQKSELLGLGGGGQANVVQPPSVYDVILMAVGPKKIQVIKVVRATSHPDLRDAKNLVESTPARVLTSSGRAEAEALQRLLEAAGATVVVETR
jgi:ribosomal protein L7/L12